MRVFGPLLAYCTLAIGAGAQDQQHRALMRAPDARGLPALEVNLASRSTQKFALVIGNSDYDVAEDLPNARADASLVAKLFHDAGYVVSEHYDLDKKEFEAALRETLFNVDFGAELAFYYAGHGVQIGDGNYLIPTDLSGGSVHDVRMGTVSLSSIMGLFSSRSRSLLAILDSCRNNPFPELKAVVSLNETPQPLKTGFAAPSSPINSLVVFSTSPGSVALDGAGDNSPFTEAFVSQVRANPNQPIDDLLRRIRRQVYVDTQSLQVPWSSSSLVETITLGEADWHGGSAYIPQAELSTDKVQLSSRLDRKVQISSVLPKQPFVDGHFLLVKPPKSGRLEIREGASFQSLQVGQPLPNTSLKNIVYATRFGGAQSGNRDVSKLEDDFEIRVGRETKQFNLSLQVDECDQQAGDHLDPNGVGVARYPNEIEPLLALEVCKEAVSKAPEIGRFQYQLGRAYLALKDLDAATAAFQHAADLDHVRAFHGLGTVELAKVSATLGQQRSEAPDTALDYFLLGVQRGDPYAYHSLGLQLLKFPQKSSDRLNGFELLSRSLELGHTFSMNALGLYFLEEDTAHYDASRGLRYLEESAARGDIYGYANLGYVALTGAGNTAKDLKRAETMFLKAADGGHPAAASSLGRMYVNGQIDGGRDYARAIEWYDLGLSRGDAWGGANAAWIIANRTPTGFTQFDATTRAAKAATTGLR